MSGRHSARRLLRAYEPAASPALRKPSGANPGGRGQAFATAAVGSPFRAGGRRAGLSPGHRQCFAQRGGSPMRPSPGAWLTTTARPPALSDYVSLWCALLRALHL
jgi:hypothetical protein